MADKKAQNMPTPNKTMDSTDKANPQTSKNESADVNRTAQKSGDTKNSKTNLTDK